MEEPIEYKFDTFKMEGHADELFIDNSKTTTKQESTDDPKIDPNKCKPFCFEWDETFVRTEANKKIPSRMMDDIGPKIEAGKKVPRIFRYAGPSSKSNVAGCSTYVNEGLVIQQVKSSRVADNYFIIGQQAWQMFDTEDKAIKKEICPYKYKEWNFKGTKYPNMAAREATKEELEADGACDPQPLF